MLRDEDRRFPAPHEVGDVRIETVGKDCDLDTSPCREVVRGGLGRACAEVDIHESDPRYREPLARDAQRLAKKLSAECEVVLLGSIATGKYVDILLENFQHRLRFPADFVGRGDMSRGGLLLRCAVDKTELTYISVMGAVRSGKRPPKLTPRRYSRASPI